MYLALWIALGTVMPYLFGYLSGRFGRARIARLGLLGSSVVVGLLGLSWNRGIAVAFLLVYGGFLFLIYPAFQSFVGTRAPARDQAVAFSLVANVQMLSGAVVILLSGFISDRFGINAPFLFLACMGFLVSAYYVLLYPAFQTEA
jgi:MFS family permease